MQHSKDSIEWKYRSMMCKLWTNFVKFADPTPNGDNPLNCKWNAVDTKENSSIDYLTLRNDSIKMEKDIYGDRIDFWKKIYTKYNVDFLNPYCRHKKY